MNGLYLGIYKGTRMSFFRHNNIGRVVNGNPVEMYSIGTFANNFKFQNIYGTTNFTIKEIRKITKNKGWSQVSRKNIEHFEIQEIVEKT